MTHVPADAENAVILYKRYLRDIASPNVPRAWAEDLLAHLEILLDAHAELVVYMDPPDFEEDVEHYEPDWEDDIPDEYDPEPVDDE